VILILEVTSPQPTKLGSASRQTFNTDGGSIGREHDNSWVLPHAKVSGHHALISYRNSVYYIEDTSRNGVCLNSTKNRLERGRSYPLSAGDRILIDPYEIQVSISGEQREAVGRRASPLADLQFGSSDPFETSDDPFAPRSFPSSGLDAPEEGIAGQEVDPLALLDLGAPKRPPARKAPRAKDLDMGSILDQHYQPPEVLPSPPSAARGDPMSIPQDYDPLAPDTQDFGPFAPRVSPPVPAPFSPPVPAPFSPPPPPRERPVHRPDVPPPPPIAVAPVRTPSRAESPEPSAGVAPAAGLAHPYEGRGPAADLPSAADFAEVLAGAGLNPADVTPELARTFGQILRVVVSGVMDVMRSRQQIKDEFRMRMTQFRPAENNPLKFSANVDDALHNLLVKRNAAYLAPVEAFEDAFTDLRNHQIAMLAGMRVAFESMLAEFDPDHLQQEFDRQLSKGLIPAKLRYWDLYREKRDEMVKDPEASFRRLFGEEFARAYEEQLKQLKAKDGSGGRGSPRTPRPSDT
jgi:type VI secretion system FHA domain protein